MEFQRGVYKIDEAAQLLGLSRNSAYEAIKRGEIPVIRFGRRIVIPKASLDRLLETGATSTT
jgi:excisionase family DNA binding protein